MRRVFSSFDRIAVHHARNLLDAEGIRAEVRNDRLASAMGELPPAECQAELWLLDAADGWRADEVLRAAAAGAGPAWLCRNCGERGEGQFTQCWRCGRDRPA